MDSDPERFIETFASVWAAPQPERFPELFAENGWLLHPGMQEPLPAAHVVPYIEAVKAAAPDIRLVVHDWAERTGTLYVDWTMQATVDDRTVTWIGADKCVLEGPRALSITALFDSHPLWVAVEPSMARSYSIERAIARRTEVAV